VRVAAVDSRLEAAAPQSFLGGYFDEAAINRTRSEWGIAPLPAQQNLTIPVAAIHGGGSVLACSGGE
jgi:hypothetical protein